MYVSYDNYRYHNQYRRRVHKTTGKETVLRFVKSIGCLSIFLLAGILLWKLAVSPSLYFNERVYSAANVDVTIAQENISEILLAGDGAAEEEITVIEKVRTTPLVVLDPGHGGEDEGCSRNEIAEKILIWRLPC